MPVPDFQTLMRPTLVALDDGQVHTIPQIREHLATALGITDAEQAELLPSGKQSLFTNRVAWALTHLRQAGVVARPIRAQYLLTERGREVLSAHPDRVDMHALTQFPEYLAFRRKKRPGTLAPAASPSEVAMQEVSPSEAVGSLVEAADAVLADELLDRVLAQPPVFLERLALRLLAAMGYGGRDTVLEHTGRSGDAGLDGLVRQDALGLDTIGMQAKRYGKSDSVGRPDLQAFVGALHGAGATRGVFVTTARFSAGAKQFAEGVSMSLVLIDGAELTRQMLRYNVGVVARETFELKDVDETFFEE